MEFSSAPTSSQLKQTRSRLMSVASIAHSSIGMSYSIDEVVCVEKMKMCKIPGGGGGGGLRKNEVEFQGV